MTDWQLNRHGFKISNQCAACEEDFGSLHAFDSHRVLHDACLTPDEMTAANWRPDKYGRWRTPAGVVRVRYSPFKPSNASRGKTTT